MGFLDSSDGCHKLPSSVERPSTTCPSTSGLTLLVVSLSRLELSPLLLMYLFSSDTRIPKSKKELNSSNSNLPSKTLGSSMSQKFANKNFMIKKKKKKKKKK